MNNSSNSTLLINCAIALSTKTPDFPHPLWQKGFQLETIEPRILLSDKSQANPDLQLKKNEDSLLFFECKDGHCEKQQLERYQKITSDDIKRNKITSLTAPFINHDLVYFCTKQKEEKIIKSIEKDNNSFPIVILEKNAIKHCPFSSKFKNPLLNDIFKEIPFESHIPQNFIPFSVDDDNETITNVLLQHFISKSSYQFTLEELLEELFSHVINNYSSQAVKDLKGRIGKILNTMMNSPELSEFFSLKGHTYSFKKTAQKKFTTNCLKMIEQNKKETEKKIETAPQSSLEKFL